LSLEDMQKFEALVASLEEDEDVDKVWFNVV
jgi:transcriptional/translational regulatory protein YebC/TACO1